jgi:hypothetical protein
MRCCPTRCSARPIGCRARDARRFPFFHLHRARLAGIFYPHFEIRSGAAWTVGRGWTLADAGGPAGSAVRWIHRRRADDDVRAGPLSRAQRERPRDRISRSALRHPSPGCFQRPAPGVSSGTDPGVRTPRTPGDATNGRDVVSRAQEGESAMNRPAPRINLETAVATRKSTAYRTTARYDRAAPYRSSAVPASALSTLEFRLSTVVIVLDNLL